MLEAKMAENGQASEAKPGSLRWNARKLLELGEPASIREVADRLDGKAHQSIDADMTMRFEDVLGQLTDD